MRISVKADVKAALRHLDSVKRQQVPFATSKAINEVLKTSAPAVQAEMRRVFDRPTRWTLNSYRVLKWANKRSLYGIVGFKDVGYKGGPDRKSGPAAGDYLQPHMQGGARGAKGLETLLRRRGLLGAGEFVVPSSYAPRDAYGNVSLSTIKKILANLGALTDAYSNTPKGGGRGGKKKSEYFFTRRGVRGARLTAIWRRAGDSAIPMFIVVSGAPTYRRVFDHVKVVQKEVNRRFPVEFDKALKLALQTARP